MTITRPRKSATATCPNDRRVLGVGAALSIAAPGAVSLSVAVPDATLKRASSVAVENTPTTRSWDFLIAQAICSL